MTLQPNFSNTSSQEHSLSFSQHFSYPMPLLRTTPLVQLLLHIDTSWPLSRILSCSAHFSALPMHALYPSFILCATPLSHSPSAATCDSRYLKQSTFSHASPFSITCSRPPLPYLEHLITLLLPTLTLNFLLRILC